MTPILLVNKGELYEKATSLSNQNLPAFLHGLVACR